MSKKANKLNKVLKVTFIMFFITGILTLIIILNKGILFGHRLVAGAESKKEELHLIQAVAGNYYLLSGGTTELYVNIDGEDVTEGYEIKVSDDSIVSVTGNVVTALKEGKVTISVTSKEYNVKSDVIINVVNPVTKLNIESEFKVIKVGEKCKITSIYSPEDADIELEYTISDKSVVTLEVIDDENAEVTGISKGTVTVIATDKISGKTASFSVEVK